jgi:hypothetical protein
MSALFYVELRRALTRRNTRILALVAVLGIVLAAILTATHSHRDGAAQPVLGPTQEQCVSDSTYGFPGQPGSEERVQFCDRQARGYATRAFDATLIPDRLKGSAAFASIAFLMLGASLIGAEWRAGTVTTVLTWEPRRARVFLAKLLAALTVAAIGYVVVQVLHGSLLWLVAATRGSTAHFDGDAVRALFGAFGRGAAFAGVMTTLGFALGNLGRNTAAAVGIGFIYTSVLENLIGVAWKATRPWLFTSNAIALVSGHRFEFDQSTHTHGPVGAGLTLAMYAVVVGAASMAWFRARDVT